MKRHQDFTTLNEWATMTLYFQGIYRQGEKEEEYVDNSKLFFFRSEESTLF